MTQSTTSYRQATFQVTGFDRLHFVGDVTGAVPQDEWCLLTGLAFEANGIRVDGRLTVRVRDENRLAMINHRLRSVKGLVSMIQTN